MVNYIFVIVKTDRFRSCIVDTGSIELTIPKISLQFLYNDIHSKRTSREITGIINLQLLIIGWANHPLKEEGGCVNILLLVSDYRPFVLGFSGL